MRKLTLTADPEVVNLAKRLTSERGTSVSALFSQFIRSMAKSAQGAKVPGKTRRATGLVKLPKEKIDRELIEKAMAERFLR